MSSLDETVITSACRAVWGKDAPAVCEHLRDLLAQPPRAYHTAHHVAAMLHLLSQWAPDAPHTLIAAVLFHDAVYDPQRSDNEERSADLFTSMVPDAFTNAETAETVRLIRLTQTHDPSPEDRNGVLLTSADLWILGSPPDEYAAYAEAIRHEYAHVPDDAWRTGRARVLRTFLEREHLYPVSPHSPAGSAEREDAARRNLAAEIAEVV